MARICASWRCRPQANHRNLVNISALQKYGTETEPDEKRASKIVSIGTAMFLSDFSLFRGYFTRSEMSLLLRTAWTSEDDERLRALVGRGASVIRAAAPRCSAG
jgi:hypothetical protein